MPAYKFDTVMSVGDDHEIVFACEAKYTYYGPHNGRGIEPNEDASVTILSIYGQRVENGVPCSEEVKMDFLDCAGLREEILAAHEAEREYARESAEAWRHEERRSA